ncbi:class I SAM-dependent DNA methyltransferase [Alishewanella sp. SMS8]|uniref:type I restriction-modification system subunit M n=1 Tax=Alishewanella sp. SMS8 TaxID=2994676 RepID=UPI002741D355|nr:class I SAM-dependent DNA methyltransferase [Alishewanella sp. SMS8]MDP5460063.1 class I SAM-dependent DNA methyltransferase [Alishewanella sp. SMS8]
MNNSEQQFLKELDVKLWSAADRLRNNLDAANYKHVVLGIIFLKYVSDAFEERQQELRQLFTQDDSDDNIYFMPREDYDSDEEYNEAVNTELELHEYYQEKNIFWVPEHARWKFIRKSCVLPIGTTLWTETVNENGEDKLNEVKLRSISWLIDNALDEVERSNKRLKGIVNRISSHNVDNDKLIGLINNFSDTSFTNPEFDGNKLNLHSKDILGHVYEYFLGQFALAEGKQGGQYYTPKNIVDLIVELLQPFKGRVFDPAMGSGGFFVSSEKFIESHAKDKHYDPSEQKKHISVYGQESNPTTWKLAAMNMAIRGIDFNFGKKNADSFTDDQHPDLRADFVMANPPFNIKEWWSKSLENDVRWKFGVPPQSNANFAWIQHMLYHLSPTGKAAIVLANMSLASSDSSESKIRKELIENDLVDCIINLPDKLFTSTPIGACIWILNKNKKNRKEILFIDASKQADAISRTSNKLKDGAIGKISSAYRIWLDDRESFSPENDFSNSTSTAEVLKNGASLFPSAYLNFTNSGAQSVSLADEFTKIKNDISAIDSHMKKISSMINKVNQLYNDPKIEKKTYRLSEILKKSTEKLGEREEPEVLTCTETTGLIFQRDRFASRVATENTAKYKIVKEGYIVYNPYLLWAGSIDQCWIVEVGITSPAYEVFEIKPGFDKTLIGICLKSELMLNKYDGISVGTVKRRRRAPAEKFLDLEITLPVLNLTKEDTQSFQEGLRFINNFTRATKELIGDSMLNLFQKANKEGSLNE